MNPDFSAAMRQALQLTRSQNLMEATRVIQRALAGLERAAPPVDEPRERALAPPPPPVVSPTADAVEPPPQHAHRQLGRCDGAAAFRAHATIARRSPETAASGRT